MIASCTDARVDTTPRLNGYVDGIQTTLTAGGGWNNIGPSIAVPAEGGKVRISWECYGWQVTGGVLPAILSVGQCWVQTLDGVETVVEVVETFTDARIRPAIDDPVFVMQAQADASEDWTFVLKLAYDTEGRAV